MWLSTINKLPFSSKINYIYQGKSLPSSKFYEESELKSKI